MRSTGSGPLGALLMLAPLIAVPILAVVGIPQFAPGNLLDTQSSNSGSSSRDHRAPLEPRYGDDARHDADDLFAPLEETSDLADEFDDPLKPRKRTPKRGSSRRADELDFNESESGFDQRGSSNDPDEDIAESELDPADSNFDFDSGDRSSGSSNHGRRPGSRKPSPRDEFSEGERFADITDPSSDEPRQGAEVPEAEEANPFEPDSTRPSHPRAKQRPSESASRDPYDAPFFDPVTPPGQNEVRRDEAEEEAPALPPSSKSPSTGKFAPRKQPVEPADENPDETVPQEPDVLAEPTEDLTWQSATKRLRALGVGKSKQHFTYIEDRNVFLFTCSAIRLNDPTKTKRFEAEADEPLLAVRQVLEELEMWQASGTNPSTRPRTSIADR